MTSKATVVNLRYV